MKDKFLRQLIFGKYDTLGKIGKRGHTITFPKASEDDKERSFTFRGDDGLILAFLKRIEKLEKNLKVN